ncbi:MAG: hypothetical protein Q9M91_02145 [Candidatus Dojkabacteria bacterium]|nr:hypothetical protein [Candidatus Dojkabacteria bacterium]MDQ7020625.1 hypothetical protein [Candidatus Dojkabacteria bacterium]
MPKHFDMSLFDQARTTQLADSMRLLAIDVLEEVAEIVESVNPGTDLIRQVRATKVRGLSSSTANIDLTEEQREAERAKPDINTRGPVDLQQEYFGHEADLVNSDSIKPLLASLSAKIGGTQDEFLLKFKAEFIDKIGRKTGLAMTVALELLNYLKLLGQFSQLNMSDEFDDTMLNICVIFGNAIMDAYGMDFAEDGDDDFDFMDTL